MGLLGGAPPTAGADSGRLFAAGVTYICCGAWPLAYDCFVRCANGDTPTRYNLALCCFHVGWYEESYRLLAEAKGWAGQEVVDASGRRYTIRRCREIGPVGLYGRIGPVDRRTVHYETVFEEEVRRCPLPELQAWIAREYLQSEWFREACWRNAADFRQVVYSCRSFEELARMFRCHPEEEPSIRRDLVRFLIVALVVGVVIGLLARYT